MRHSGDVREGLIVSRRVAAAILIVFVASACSGARADQRSAAGATGSPAGTTGVPSVSATPAPAPSPSPQPVRSNFAGRISAIPAGLAREMRGTTWKPGCPVPISDLRLLHFNYWNFDGVIMRGPMVVNASAAEGVLSVFRQLFDARFPLKRVALAKEYKPNHDDPNDRRSVTASFNCRPAIRVSGPTSIFSQHAYGLAVDVNPLQNPEVSLSGQVRDRFARIYRDRTLDLPGMIHSGDVVVRAFAAIGWKWGGDWHSMKDYMHFSQTGT